MATSGSGNPLQDLASGLFGFLNLSPQFDMNRAENMAQSFDPTPGQGNQYNDWGLLNFLPQEWRANPNYTQDTSLIDQLEQDLAQSPSNGGRGLDAGQRAILYGDDKVAAAQLYQTLRGQADQGLYKRQMLGVANQYDQKIGELNPFLDMLQKNITTDLNTPAYNESQVRDIQGQNKSQLANSRDDTIQNTLNLFNQGSQGVAADLVTRARTAADQAIASGATNIKLATDKANTDEQGSDQAIATQFGALRNNINSESGRFRAGLQGAAYAPYDAGQGFRDILDLGNTREANRFSNQQILSGARTQSADEMNSMIDRIMQGVGIFNSRPGAGPSGQQSSNPFASAFLGGVGGGGAAGLTQASGNYLTNLFGTT